MRAPTPSPLFLGPQPSIETIMGDQPSPKSPKSPTRPSDRLSPPARLHLRSIITPQNNTEPKLRSPINSPTSTAASLFQSLPPLSPTSPSSPRHELPLPSPKSPDESFSQSLDRLVTTSTTTITAPLSPLIVTVSPKVPAFTQPPPPPSPSPWRWRCHSCGSTYRLGCTRRCLECSHTFCSGNVSSHGSSRRSRGGPCRAEFDYDGWASWGSWRRDLAQPETEKKSIESKCDELLAPEGVDITKAKEDARIKRFMNRGQKNCARDCDYPSECYHAVTKYLHEKDEEDEANWWREIIASACAEAHSVVPTADFFSGTTAKSATSERAPAQTATELVDENGVSPLNAVAQEEDGDEDEDDEQASGISYFPKLLENPTTGTTRTSQYSSEQVVDSLWNLVNSSTPDHEEEEEERKQGDQLDTEPSETAPVGGEEGQDIHNEDPSLQLRRIPASRRRQRSNSQNFRIPRNNTVPTITTAASHNRPRHAIRTPPSFSPRSVVVPRIADHDLDASSLLTTADDPFRYLPEGGPESSPSSPTSPREIFFMDEEADEPTNAAWENKKRPAAQISISPIAATAAAATPHGRGNKLSSERRQQRPRGGHMVLGQQDPYYRLPSPSPCGGGEVKGYGAEHVDWDEWIEDSTSSGGSFAGEEEDEETDEDGRSSSSGGSSLSDAEEDDEEEELDSPNTAAFVRARQAWMVGTF